MKLIVALSLMAAAAAEEQQIEVSTSCAQPLLQQHSYSQDFLVHLINSPANLAGEAPPRAASPALAPPSQARDLLQAAAKKSNTNGSGPTDGDHLAHGEDRFGDLTRFLMTAPPAAHLADPAASQARARASQERALAPADGAAPASQARAPPSQARNPPSQARAPQAVVKSSTNGSGFPTKVAGVEMTAGLRLEAPLASQARDPAAGPASPVRDQAAGPALASLARDLVADWAVDLVMLGLVETSGLVTMLAMLRAPTPTGSVM